jgi:hypothetical protein
LFNPCNLIGFVVVWATNSGQIRGQRHGSDGRRVGAPFGVSQTSTVARGPDLVALGGTAFGIVWHGNSDGSASGNFGRMFNQ